MNKHASGHSASRPVVSVFGGGRYAPADETYRLAMAVGRELATLGYTIANGGYGGTMEASARGAAEAGGETIGVTCSVWKTSPNRYITRTIPTADLAERLTTLIELGVGGYVVLPGATGTLSELARVWEYKCRGHLADRPLVCVWRFWQRLLEIVDSVQPHSSDEIAIAESPAAMAEYFRHAGGP